MSLLFFCQKNSLIPVTLIIFLSTDYTDFTVFLAEHKNLYNPCNHVDKIKSTDYRQPTPNRGQSSLLELPRCEGGKDHKVGLTDNRLPSGWGPLTVDR